MIWSLLRFQSLYRNFPEGISQVECKVAMVSDGVEREHVIIKQVCPLPLLLCWEELWATDYKMTERARYGKDEIGHMTHLKLKASDAFILASNQCSQGSALLLYWLIASWAGEGKSGEAERPLWLLDYLVPWGYVNLGCPEAAVLVYMAKQ